MGKWTFPDGEKVYLDACSHCGAVIKRRDCGDNTRWVPASPDHQYYKWFCYTTEWDGVVHRFVNCCTECGGRSRRSWRAQPPGVLGRIPRS